MRDWQNFIDDQPTSTWVTFSVSGVEFGVCGHDQHLLDLLDHYEIKSQTSTAEDVSYRIVVTRSRQTLTQLSSFLDFRSELVVRPVPISYFTFGRNGEKLLRSAKGHQFEHCIAVCGQTIAVIAAEDAGNALSQTVLRLIREVSLRENENRGGVLVHAAAAVSSSGQGVLIFGPKGSGKTSCATTLVSRHDFAYLANDRCFLHLEQQGTVRVRSWPLPLRIGVGLIKDAFPELSRPANWSRAQTAALADAMKAGDYNLAALQSDEGKLELHPDEFLRSVGGKQSDTAILRILVNATISLAEPGRLQDAIWSTTKDVLIADTLRTPFDDSYPIDWLGLRRGSQSDLVESSNKLVQALAKLKGYEITGRPQEALAILLTRPEFSSELLATAQ